VDAAAERLVRSTFAQVRISVSTSPVVCRLGAPLVAVVLLGSMLSGCGKDATADRPTAADDTPTASISPTPTPSPTPSPSTPPSPTPTKKPTKKPPGSTGGNGDSAGDNEPATAGGGICAHLDAAEIGRVVGGTVTGSGLPGGGCGFHQSNQRATAVSLVETVFSKTSGGMDGAKTGATSAVEGAPEDLTNIGDAAFVVTGTAFGGEDLQAAGAVKIGNRLINVSLTQSVGLTRAKVRAILVNLLKLSVAEAG
jgi:hypothetical protein